MNATPLSFCSTFLKLCRCFVDVLKMCMWFGHDRQIMNSFILLICELICGYFVKVTPLIV